MRGPFAVSLVVVCAFALTACGQPEAPAEPEPAPIDATAVATETADAFVAAYNRHDAAAVAQYFVEDGVVLAADGQRHVGRAAIETYYTNSFGQAPEVRLTHTLHDARQLGPDAMVSSGSYEISNVPMPDGTMGTMQGAYSTASARVNGEWKLVGVHAAMNAPSLGAAPSQ